MAAAAVVVARMWPEAGIVTPADAAPDLVRGLIAGARLTVATRLHASVLATASGVPSIVISHEPKVSGLHEVLGVPDSALPPTLDCKALVVMAEKLLSEGAGDAIGRRVAMLKERARMAGEALMDLCVDPRPWQPTDRGTVRERLAALRAAL